jgi:hypothetical protein
MKEKLNAMKAGSLMKFRAMITQLYFTISEEFYQKIITHVSVHLEEVVRQNGSHTEHIWH